MNLSRLFKRDGGRLLASALFALTSVPAVALQAADQPVLLRLKFTKGQITRYRLSMHMTGAMAGMGSFPIPELSMTTRQVVLNVLPDGSGEVKTTVAMAASPGGGAAAGPMAGMFGGMAGSPRAVKPVVATYSPRGALSGMTGMPTDNPMMGPMSKMFSGSSSPFVYLPEQAVSPGDTWDMPINMPGLTTGAVAKLSLAKVVHINGKTIAVIHVTMDMPLDIDLGALAGAASGSNTPSPVPAGLKMTGSMKADGDTHFNVDAGRVDDTVSTVDMDMHMSMPPGTPGAAQAPNGITFTMKMTMKMSLLPSAPIRTIPHAH